MIPTEMPITWKRVGIETGTVSSYIDTPGITYC